MKVDSQSNGVFHCKLDRFQQFGRVPTMVQFTGLPVKTAQENAMHCAKNDPTLYSIVMLTSHQLIHLIPVPLCSEHKYITQTKVWFVFESRLHIVLYPIKTIHEWHFTLECYGLNIINFDCGRRLNLKNDYLHTIIVVLLPNIFFRYDLM